jgi:hypothetical protein
MRSGSTSPRLVEEASGSSTGMDTETVRAESPKGKGRDDGKRPTIGERIADQVASDRTKVISPELRALLSRKVEVLPRKEVRKKGEGVATLKK